MSKQSDKAERDRLAQQQQQVTQQTMQLAQQAAEPSALTKQYESMMQKRLDFFNQGAPNYDMSQTDKEGKPLFPGGPVFADAATREARAKREAGRTGLGAISMGTYGTSPGQMAQLNASRVRHESQDASLDAADAVNQGRAETFGSVLPLQASRTSGYSAAGSMYGGLGSNIAAQRAAIPRPVPWWQTALQAGGTAGGIALGAGA